MGIQYINTGLNIDLGKSRILFITWTVSIILMTILSGEAFADSVSSAGSTSGFSILSENLGGTDLLLGGSFWLDYRAYAESQRADNRFDIRRARLNVSGQLTRWFRYFLEYEFEGNEINHMKDAYGEFGTGSILAVRLGQFKEPFSLEWQTSDKAQWFAERSMGNSLTPGRDVGLMLKGSVAQDSFYYGIGLFNGDGLDDSSSGSQDSPEIASRIALKPFGTTSSTLLKDFQIGVSGSYAKIDTSNIDLKVKSTGMAGLSRSLYVLSHDTKFGVFQDVDTRKRYGIEAAWIDGPYAITGEYTALKYSGLTTATIQPKNADFSSWYISMAYCLTGENFSLAGGVANPINPKKIFDPDKGTYGAIVVAARVDHFNGDHEWITQGENVSVRDADALSVAATWILSPMLKVMIDYTYTDLSDPIRVRVNPNGSIEYINRENVFTLRFMMDL
jgi:phosphate-selective porin OprO/OprP